MKLAEKQLGNRVYFVRPATPDRPYTSSVGHVADDEPEDGILRMALYRKFYLLALECGEVVETSLGTFSPETGPAGPETETVVRAHRGPVTGTEWIRPSLDGRWTWHRLHSTASVDGPGVWFMHPAEKTKGDS